MKNENTIKLSIKTNILIPILFVLIGITYLIFSIYSIPWRNNFFPLANIFLIIIFGISCFDLGKHCMLKKISKEIRNLKKEQEDIWPYKDE